ncbi:hypothetical protein MuYL_4281 [Mucilaginibacter xinganensis]|uniref:Uncharacterized protein n=1 Tax=Mucilaginibacter xinganensis TaxID=1234841 RepID=A0A223P254_9SPHI|nr:hypothetical protein MuYL_4281 [Mucilaginibacter xinganensis]
MRQQHLMVLLKVFRDRAVKQFALPAITSYCKIHNISLTQLILIL